MTRTATAESKTRKTSIPKGLSGRAATRVEMNLDAPLVIIGLLRGLLE
ncbi:hypothetical protein Vi05172_g8467 [Venturia inaequalis]|nr:hypothetical protein Vi05172_g8467 [Venturia inaequalis]